MTQKKTHEKVCEQCGEKYMTRHKSQRCCSPHCAMVLKHQRVEFRYKTGTQSPLWKPEMDNYKSMHVRVNRQRGKADRCEFRPEKGCTSVKYEWAHIHDTDPWDVANYQMLCKSCHLHYDGLTGTNFQRSKLTMEQVAEIRASTDLQKHLADRYGVTQATISNAITGKTYR